MLNRLKSILKDVLTATRPGGGDSAPARPLRVCIATTMGGYDHATVLDRVLAKALVARGAEVELLLCDKAVPSCQMIKLGPKRAMPEQLVAGDPLPYCDWCVKRGGETMVEAEAPIRQMSDYITDEERAWALHTSQTIDGAEIPTFTFEGLPVGDHAKAGALRYFARGDLREEPLGIPVLRRYLQGGLLTIKALKRLIETHKYDIVVVNHGIYIPQGMIAEVSRAMGARVVTYNPAYRKSTFVFSHNESYHFTMLDEPTATWRGLKMTEQLKQDTRQYLMSRRTGANDWIWFHDAPKEDVSPVLAEIGADPNKPFVLALTSVVWDAQLHYKSIAFPNMMDWLEKTIAYWGTRTDDLQLVIRIHPAEVRGAVPSRQLCAEEIAKAFPTLPRNVFVITPDNQASTYALGDACNAAIIFNTKAGVEMAATGTPVIVAGEAWVRGKGFARDVSSPADYFALLNDLPLRAGMSDDQKALAEKYAYHFFFRRMIPLPFIQVQKSGHFTSLATTREALAPGLWPGLDTICDGILTGAPFIYPAERLEDPFPGEKAPAEEAA